MSNSKVLGISEEQQKRIRETAKAADREMHEKIRKLKAEAIGKVLAQFTAAQQQKLKELQGEEMQLEQPTPKPRAVDSQRR